MAAKKAAKRPPAKKLAWPSVEEAIQLDLKDLEQISPGLSKTGLAATALTLARELDSESNSATAKGNCARALNATVHQLVLHAGLVLSEDNEGDTLDALRARRSARIEGRAGT